MVTITLAESSNKSLQKLLLCVIIMTISVANSNKKRANHIDGRRKTVI